MSIDVLPYDGTSGQRLYPDSQYPDYDYQTLNGDYSYARPRWLRQWTRAEHRAEGQRCRRPRGTHWRRLLRPDPTPVREHSRPTVHTGSPATSERPVASQVAQASGRAAWSSGGVLSPPGGVVPSLEAYLDRNAGGAEGMHRLCRSNRREEVDLRSQTGWRARGISVRRAIWRA